MRTGEDARLGAVTASSVLQGPLADGAGLGLRGRWARAGTTRRVQVLAGFFGLLLIAATLEIVIDAAVGGSPLIPYSPDITGWMNGLGVPLGFRTFLIALLAFCGSYAGIILLRKASTRALVILLVVLQVIVSVGPVLLSTDVFSYLAYARMGAVHGVNPYLYGPIAIQSDPIYEFVGGDWIQASTAYGPLYTIISYPVALLGVIGSLIGMKLIALAASLGTLWLTWRCAARRGIDTKLAVLVVGANPLWVIYGLGGAHNDLLMILMTMIGVSLALSGREASAAVSVVAGTLIKATAAVLLPFMVLGSDLRRLEPASDTATQPGAEALARPAPARRKAVILATVGSLVVGLGVGYLLFGKQGINLIAGADRDSVMVSRDSFPLTVMHLFGKPGVFPIDHKILKAMLVVVVAFLLWRTWKGYDWVAASGWALLAVAVSSTWLLAWYTLWCLPLAAVSRDRRLLFGTFLIQGLFIVHQLPPLFAEQP